MASNSGEQVVKLRNAQTYGADNTGLTNAGAALAAGLSDKGSAPFETPYGTYLTSALTLTQAGKLYGCGATLKPSANNMAVLTLAQNITIGSADFQLVRDLVINGTGKTGITGIKGGGPLVAGLILENVVAYGCDTIGFDLQCAQFMRSLCLKANNGAGAGMLIRNVAVDGGGNSHDHYQFQAYNNAVGVVVNGTNFVSGIQSINFYNPLCLQNSVCGMAFFDAQATIYGGAPESNATGAATIVIDGKTVKRSSIYLKNSHVDVVELQQGETSACDPMILLESNSVLSLRNFRRNGGTGAGYLLVSADSTSSVHLEGCFGGQGTVQNVTSWPDSLILPTAAQVCLYGEPVHKIDPTLAPLYAEQASAWASSGVSAPTVNAFAEDVDLGYCRSVTFQAVVGGLNTNAVNKTLGNGAASKDSLITVLMKSDTDCKITAHLFDGTSFNVINPTEINLKANKVIRIVLGKRNIAAGGVWQLFVYSTDGVGTPNIKIANLQVWQGATGTQTTTQEISKIVRDGSFWPGITRETQVNLRLLAQSVNTMGKFPGKQVWDTTNNRVVFAAGSATGDVWKDGVNTTVHTPI